MKRFAVSRTTVRSALQRLQHLGLADSRRGCGRFLTRAGMKASGLLGLLIPERIEAQFYTNLSRAIVKRGFEHGYSFLIGDVGVDDKVLCLEQTMRFVQEFVLRRVEGLLYRPFLDVKMRAQNREVVETFRKADIPVVLIDSDIEALPRRSDFDLVHIDNVSAGRLVAEYLMSIGRRHIAFLLPKNTSEHMGNCVDRLFGVSGAVVAAGFKWTDRNVLGFSPDDVSALRRAMRNDGIRIDAVVCCNDDSAVRLQKSLAAIGMSVPRDVAVAGFDDSPCAQAATPSITTICQPVDQIADAACNRLLQRIAKPDMPPLEIVFRAPLVVRESAFGLEKSKKRRIQT